MANGTNNQAIAVVLVMAAVFVIGSVAVVYSGSMVYGSSQRTDWCIKAEGSTTIQYNGVTVGQDTCVPGRNAVDKWYCPTVNNKPQHSIVACRGGYECKNGACRAIKPY